MARMGRPPKPARLRFMRQTLITDSGCIEWTGRIDKYGYGQFLPAGGRAAKKVGAHRWAYEHFIGTIPDGLQIDHLCRNRACVNPAHLEAVTPRENVMRSPIAAALVNASKTHCINDHPLSGDNLRIRDGKRSCRTCAKASNRANYLRNRDAVLERGRIRKAQARKASA